ncbi:MAG: hypothetical protein AAF787_14445 [Chloroflexota bacterium]
MKHIGWELIDVPLEEPQCFECGGDMMHIGYTGLYEIWECYDCDHEIVIMPGDYGETAMWYCKVCDTNIDDEGHNPNCQNCVDENEYRRKKHMLIERYGLFPPTSISDWFVINHKEPGLVDWDGNEIDPDEWKGEK